jgi:hypothetical protein
MALRTNMYSNRGKGSNKNAYNVCKPCFDCKPPLTSVVNSARSLPPEGKREDSTLLTVFLVVHEAAGSVRGTIVW